MIKTKVKNYWVMIALFIIANVIIFKLASQKLENYIVKSTAQAQEAQEAKGL